MPQDWWTSQQLSVSGIGSQFQGLTFGANFGTTTGDFAGSPGLFTTALQEDAGLFFAQCAGVKGATKLTIGLGNFNTTS